MIKLIEGFRTSLSNDFEEGYRIDRPDHITVLAGADKILALMKSFVSDSSTPLSFAISIPSKLEDMIIVRDANDTQLGLIEREKMDVFAIEDLNKDKCLEILNRFGDVIVNDGLSFFSFVRKDGVRLVKGKYNTVKALNANEDISNLAYLAFLLRRNAIPESDQLITVEEVITDGDSVISMVYENGKGLDIYSVVDCLIKDYGMHDVEQSFKAQLYN